MINPKSSRWLVQATDPVFGQHEELVKTEDRAEALAKHWKDQGYLTLVTELVARDHQEEGGR